MGLNAIAAAIQAKSLPDSLAGLFDGAGPADPVMFCAVTPHNLVLGVGAQIVTTAIAFHNTSGGLFVFGASGPDFAETVENAALNPEVFDWVVSNWTGDLVETVRATYPHPTQPAGSIEVVLVAARQGAALRRLNQGFGGFAAGDVLVHTEHGVVPASACHFDLLCGAGGAPPSTPAMSPRGLPPAPPAPWSLIGRDRQMIELLQWFSQGASGRVFLDGPDGAGKTTLAAEFGRRLAASGGSLVLPGGARLDHVLFLGEEDPDFSQWALDHRDLLRDPALVRFARILHLAGWFAGGGPIGDAAWLEAQLRLFFATSNGLIILDDGQPADERLLVKVLSANGHNKLIHARGRAGQSVVDRTISVPGFSLDEEYSSFLALCAAQMEVEPPNPRDHAVIARWTGGLPRYLEAVVAKRRFSTDYAEALKLFRRELAA